MTDRDAMGYTVDGAGYSVERSRLGTGVYRVADGNDDTIGHVQVTGPGFGSCVLYGTAGNSTPGTMSECIRRLVKRRAERDD